MYKFTFTTAILLIFSLSVFAQQQRSCGSMDHLEMMMEQHPEVISNISAIENHTRNFIANGAVNRAVVTIPVVVHVIYNTASENISDAQVLSQIDVLNADFRRTNIDANDTWPQAADTEIEFCMATVDPSGNPTNGINRVQTSKSSFRANDDMKKPSGGGASAWDASQYLNIWVCNLANGLLGYAQFPGGSLTTDGVVCLYNAFGTQAQDDGSFVLNGSYNLGRTTTHEVGHWLNLRHIWGDGSCSATDFVDDTPDSDGANYDCETTSSCSSVDMHQNYMDYTYDVCMNLFTAGQSARMNATLVPGGFHHSLTQSTVCSGAVNPGDTCANGMQDGDETGIDCGGSCSTACPEPSSCATPAGLSYRSKQRGRRATLRWSGVGSANSYNIVLSDASGIVNSSNTTSTSITYRGLTTGNDYSWTVSAVCADGTSTPATATFTAGVSGRLHASENLSIAPTPASDFITVVYTFAPDNQLKVVENTRIKLTVVNLFGKVIQETTIEDMDDGLKLDVSNFQAGMYMLVLEQDGEKLSKKFVVSRL